MSAQPHIAREPEDDGVEERLANLESRVTELETWRAFSYGVVAVLSGLLGWLLSFFDGRK